MGTSEGVLVVTWPDQQFNDYFIYTVTPQKQMCSQLSVLYP